MASCSIIKTFFFKAMLLAKIRQLEVYEVKQTKRQGCSLNVSNEQCKQNIKKMFERYDFHIWEPNVGRQTVISHMSNHHHNKTPNLLERIIEQTISQRKGNAYWIRRIPDSLSAFPWKTKIFVLACRISYSTHYPLQRRP